MNSNPTTSVSVRSRHTGNPRRKLITALIAGVFIAMTIIAAIVYFTSFYISKADYRQAVTQVNEIVQAYTAVDSASASYVMAATGQFATDSDIAAKKATYESANASYQSSIARFSTARALRNAEVTSAYDVFVAKNTKYVAGYTGMTILANAAHTIATNCSQLKTGLVDTDDLSKLLEVYDTAKKPCTDSIKDLSSSKDSAVAKLGSDAGTHFTAIRTHVLAMQDAYNATNRGVFENEYNAFLESNKPFSAADRFTELIEQRKSLSPETEINHLSAVIVSLQ